MSVLHGIISDLQKALEGFDFFLPREVSLPFMEAWEYRKTVKKNFIEIPYYII